MTQASWSGRRVAVTGAGGFIGSHLTEALVEAGAAVRAMVRYNARDERGALEWADPSLLAQAEVRPGDIRSLESVADVVEGCDVVFHLAAQIAVPYSFTDPRTFFETNVMGTLNVIQACRGAGVGRLVHTSTSEVYGTAQRVPIDEEHPLQPQSPYAASKVGADQAVLSSVRAFELPATVVRPFNTYGPRQSARSVIPTIVSQALEGRLISLGSLEPRRDFTYVSDTVEGFLRIAATPEANGRTVQLGSGRDLSVGELVSELGAVMDRELTVESDARRIRPQGGEVMRLLATAERAHQLTGWEPRVPLTSGLAETVRWIEAHAERYRTGEPVV